jgi:hypothetical protein
MKMREVYLARDETVSDSQTKIINLNITDAISAIDVIYEATNGATSNQGVPLHKDVDKIEVVDGSDVLHSLPMPHLEAINFFEAGKYPPHTITEAAAGAQKEQATIHFGRYVGDPLLWLDPTVFKNPQLKCTHSLTISSTAGFATGTGKITVVAHVFDTKPAVRKGFLMTKDIYDWTTAASGDESVDLPVDYPYRLLALRGYESGVAWDTDITRVKMSCDEDKFIPFDLYADDLIYLNEKVFGHAEIVQRLLRTDADTPESFLAVPRRFVLNSLTDLDLASIDAVTADLVTLQVLKFATTPTIAKETSDVALNLFAAGVGPHNVLAYPFGSMDVIEDWFPAPSYKSVKLKVTQGGAGAAASVILQQLRA